MLTKFKHRIETWLKRLVAEVIAGEVSSINTSLDDERRAFYNLTKSAECTINISLARLSEMAHFKENAELRTHIKNLNSHITGVADIVKKLHLSKV